MRNVASQNSMSWKNFRVAAVSLLLSFYLQLLENTAELFRWWRPYCDSPDDGPGLFAIGFPLPHSQPSLASSMSYDTQLAMYVLDLLLVAGLVAFPVHKIQKRISRSGDQYPRFIARVAVTILTIAAVPLLFLLFYLSHPVGNLANPAYGEAYIDFRPYFLLDQGEHLPCDR